MPGKYKWLLGSALLLILLVVTFFIVRNPLLRHVVINRFKRIEQRTGADVVWQDISFSGFNGVQIKNLCVLPSTGDTLFSVDELNISMNTRYLLRFKLRVEQLTLDRPRIKLWRREGESNYLFLFGGMKDSLSGNQQSAPQVKNYSRLVKSIFEPLFQYVPQKVKIIDARLNADLDHYFIHAEMSDLSMKDAYFKSTIHLIDNGINRQWKIEGRIQPDEQNLYFKIVSGDTPRVELPYTAHRWNLTLAFDSLKVNCNYAAVSTGEVSLSGEAAAWQQVLHHPGISPDDVELRKGETHFKLNFGDTWAEVDSATAITYNKQQFHLFARYEQVPEKRYRIGINEKDMNAQVFFSSLPQGLFSNLSGIKVSGSLDFYLNFDYYPARPDSLVFHSALKSSDFKLLSYGATRFSAINDPFVYTAFENGVAVRSWVVGPENPDFVPLGQIPAYLKYAVMTSEDGAFYAHKGFIPDAIRESIITNLKQKRFARGGSTISMQLVKNVFLNRNKTITRKLEEMLITWIIEHERLVSKDRMLEVYFNVIETGPGVYGVAEAARYYFNKETKNLSLAESIFLASIVPRPKAFRYSFTREGKLQPYLENYYSLISSKMLSKGWISPEEAEKLQPHVELRGPATAYVASPIDSVPEVEQEKRGFFNFDWLKKR